MKSLQDQVVDGFLQAMSRVHAAVLRLTGGRFLSDVFGMPAVSLETIGRKSGVRRETMLTAPVVEDGKVVLVASKGGDRRNPDWFSNLLANPEVKVTMHGTSREMRARVASPEEKADLWPRIVSAYRGYAGYQRRTDRDIPVVICEPKSA